MRILDKYILKAFIGPFLFGIFAFTSIFIGTGTLFRIAQYITEYGASLWSVTRAFLLALPNIVILTFPMSVLLGSLMTFGRLSGSSEIIVMRAGGQNFLRLATPVYIMAFLISLCSIAFNEYVVPAANHAYQTIIREEIMKRATPQTQEHIVLKTLADKKINTLMYAGKYDSSTKLLSDITVQQFTDGQVTQIERAKTANWNGQYWIMHDGTIYDINASGEGIDRTLKFEEQVLPITQDPDKISRSQRKPEEMTIKEIRQQIKAMEATGGKITEWQMEMYQRFTIPVASFIFALVGAPLGLQKQRSSSSIGFGILVLVIFIYYGVMTLSGALGKGGAIPPLLAAWIPNTLGVIAGLYLNWRVSK